MRILLLNRNTARTYEDLQGRRFLDDLDDVTVLSTNAHADEFEGMGRPVVRMPSNDRASVLKTAHQLHAKRPFDFVVTVAESLIEISAQIRAELGLPGMNPSGATLLRDKIHMKARLRGSSVQVPEHVLGNDVSGAIDLLRRHRKVVVKPRSSMGSQGVETVTDPETLRRLLSDPGRAEHLEVEAFVEGAMIHVDTITKDERTVVACVSQYTGASADFRRQSCLGSFQLDDGEIKESALAANEQVLRAFGVKTGVTHLELFWTGSQIIFCEIGGRPGGSGVSPAFEVSHGINLFEAHVRTSCQLPLVFRPPRAPFAGHLLVYGSPGVIQSLPSSDAPAHSWIERTRVKGRVGEQVPAFTHASEGLVEFIVAAETSDLLKQRIYGLMAGSGVSIGLAES